MNRGRHGPPNISELSELFSKLVPRREIFIVVDALDECQKDVRESLLDCLGAHEEVRLLVTSRILDSIGRWTDSFSQLRIVANENDIHQYIDFEIDSSHHLKSFTRRDPSFNAEIKVTVTKKSNGM
jgi:hypothetical protein